MIKKRERNFCVYNKRAGTKNKLKREQSFFKPVCLGKRLRGPIQRKKLRQKKREGQRWNQTGRNHL